MKFWNHFNFKQSILAIILQRYFNYFIDKVQDLIPDPIEDMASDIGDTVSDAYSDVKDTVSDAADDISDEIDELI